MSGPNEAMEHVQTVASNLDGTDGNMSPLNWTCPEVDPYSAIYFYQASSLGLRTPARADRAVATVFESRDHEQDMDDAIYFQPL